MVNFNDLTNYMGSVGGFSKFHNEN